MRNSTAPVLMVCMCGVHGVQGSGPSIQFLAGFEDSEERSTSGLQDNAKAELALGTPVFRANPYLHMLQVITGVLV